MPSYLKSPVVEIYIGPTESATLLRAHEALLVQSPYFASLRSGSDDTPVSQAS